MPNPEDFGITKETWEQYSHWNSAARSQVAMYREALDAWKQVVSDLNKNK